MKQQHISVPVQMLIDAQINGYLKPLRFFLFLKLCYPAGKAKLNQSDLFVLEALMMIRSRKTIKKYIAILCKKGWLRLNKKTGYYLLKSIDKIREEEGWTVRKAFPVNFESCYNIKAVTGAVLYAYLHLSFWRKTRRKKSVHLKGSTYHFLSPRFNYSEKGAPIALSGITSIFKISNATASRLKKMADASNLIEVEKHYSQERLDKKAMLQCLKYNGKPNNLVYKEGGYRLQLIDTIFPLFLFTNRKKLNA